MQQRLDKAKMTCAVEDEDVSLGDTLFAQALQASPALSPIVPVVDIAPIILQTPSQQIIQDPTSLIPNSKSYKDTIFKKIEKIKEHKGFMGAKKAVDTWSHRHMHQKAEYCLAYLLMQCGVNEKEDIEGNVCIYASIKMLLSQMHGQLMKLTKLTDAMMEQKDRKQKVQQLTSVLALNSSRGLLHKQCLLYY